MKKGDYQYGLFPLRIFLFPGEQTTLHIFEPRYLQLVTCRSSLVALTTNSYSLTWSNT